MLGPSLSEAVEVVLGHLKSTMHFCYPAQVVRYDAARQTVDLRACVLREVPGQEWQDNLFEEVPELVNVPVQWARSNGFAITLPLAVNDFVTVFASSNSTLLWRERGGVNQHPGIVEDEFGLSGVFCVPGNYPDVERLRNVSTRDLEIRSEDGATKIAIAPNGSVTITASSCTVKSSQVHVDSSSVVTGNGPAPQAVALAPLVEQMVAAALVGHTHSVPIVPTPVISGPGVATAPLSSTAASNLKAT